MTRVGAWARLPSGAVRVLTLATFTATLAAVLAAVAAGSHSAAEISRLDTIAARVAFETMVVTDQLGCDSQPRVQALAQCSLALRAPLKTTGDLSITREEGGVALKVTMALDSPAPCPEDGPGITDLSQAPVRTVTVTATRGAHARTVSLREHVLAPGRTLALPARPGETVQVAGPDGTSVARRSNAAGCAYFPHLQVSEVTEGGRQFKVDPAPTTQAQGWKP